LNHGERQCRNLKKSFGAVDIIKGIDLDVADGEFCVFVGPSGCGKSTLLRMIAGAEDISAGDLKIGGRDMVDVASSERGVAMVFQSCALYPHMSVRDNIGFGLRMTGHAKDDIADRTGKAADMLRLGPLMDRKPSQLSGGQRQRVAIGRAIVREPGVFLFDEPLSNLDAALRVRMRIEIGRLHQDLKATMIYVTHDQVEAMTMADEIVVLHAGIIEQVGSPLELYHRPQNTFVAGFIGSPKMNFIKATVSGTGSGTLTLTLPGGSIITLPAQNARTAIGQKVTLGIRSEHIRADGGGEGRFTGALRLAEYPGSETMFYLSLPNGSDISVKADCLAKARPGASMACGLPANACHVFDEAGRTLLNATLDQ
jgi:multiple sugar transport system ATP-binding protein